jgi:geranylgeranyl diphosphate synthase type 3
MEDKLLEPVTYYKNLKGKNIRKLLGELFGKLLNVNDENILLINNIITDCHNASLVIDDIEDNSTTRRNQPCSHIKYGIPLALNSGYYSIFRTLITIQQNFNTEILNNIIEYLYFIHEGQGMDIYYTQHKIIPSLDDYTKMMIYKTGYVFLIHLELLMDKSKNSVFKKKHIQLKNILMKFSIFFQIRDDYINLTDPNYWKEKGFCQDFNEEKISYLITYFKTMNDTDIIEMMKDKTTEGKIKILDLFHNSGLFNKIYKKLLNLKTEILNEMKLEFLFNSLPFEEFDINNIKEIHKEK